MSTLGSLYFSDRMKQDTRLSASNKSETRHLPRRVSWQAIEYHAPEYRGS